jgi:hypothetical protein
MGIKINPSVRTMVSAAFPYGTACPLSRREWARAPSCLTCRGIWNPNIFIRRILKYTDQVELRLPPAREPERMKYTQLDKNHPTENSFLDRAAWALSD